MTGSDAGAVSLISGSFSRLDPSFHLSQVPGDVTACEGDSAWEVSSLLHVEDGTLRQRDHGQQRLSVDQGFSWKGTVSIVH